MTMYSGGKPGLQPQFQFVPREIFFTNRSSAQFMGGPVTIDGNLTSNAQNSPYTFFIYAGTVVGKVTATKKYTESIIGLTTVNYGGNQTLLYTDTLTAAEIVRRNGTSGNLSLTGSNIPNTVLNVRTLPVTYSAVNTSTGAITITPLYAAAVSAVNAVEAIPFVDSTGSGNFTITIEGTTTAPIAYSSTAATLVSNIYAAGNATWGSGAIVPSGGNLAAQIITFSGTGFAGRPINSTTNSGNVTAKVIVTLLAGATGFTAGNNPTSSGVGAALAGGSTTSTAGVTAVAAQSGDFISGSLIGGGDGSQVPLTLICDIGGIKCADGTNVNRVDAYDPQLLLAGGCINTGYIVNYPSDAGHQSWLKTSIKAFCGGVTFLDDLT
jgi:hypothetical protein